MAVNRSSLFLVGLLLASTVGAGLAGAAEDPRFETYVAHDTLVPGRTTDLAVTLVNDADEADDRVETARSVEATMRSGDTPFEIRSGTQILGAARDGTPVVSHFQVEVPRDVSSGTYHVPIDLTYEYGSDDRETTTVYATVHIADRATFRVVDTSDRTRVGADGLVNVTVENVGTAAASDATVELASKSPALTFGGAPSTNRYAGSWSPGERKTLTYEVTAKPTAEPQPYSLTATVAYDDEDGVRKRSAPLTATVTPAPERRFAVETNASDLHVGSDGTVVVDVTNEGPAVSDAQVVLVSETMGVHPEQREYAFGTLDANETATATFPVEVGDDAAAGPHRFAYRISYDQADGDRTTSRPYGTLVTIGPDRKRFDVQVVDADVAAGSSGTVTVAVTNAGEDPLTAVDAKAFTDAPFTVDDDSAFVGSLAPGATETISFGVSVPDGALAKRYPLSVDFQYDTPDGDTHLTDTYDVPVRVTPASGPPTQLLVGGGAAGLLAIGGIGYWITRD